jgi:hypothetical protein
MINSDIYNLYFIYVIELLYMLVNLTNYITIIFRMFFRIIPWLSKLDGWL